MPQASAWRRHKLARRLHHHALQWARFLDRTVFPRVCALCRERHGPNGLCAACRATLPVFSDPRCPGCGGVIDGVLDLCGECLQAGGRPWDHAVAALPYAGPVRDMVQALKYSGQTHLARPLGTLLAEAWHQHGGDQPDCIVPVPLHWRRRWRRGFNQAELLARCCASNLPLPVPVRPALRRTRPTPQQVGLGRLERRRNLRGVFMPIRRCVSALQDRHVLLLDDVMTTGSTLGEATRALRNRGVARISVLVVARD